MKTLCVLQHTSGEFLGLMEDHLEQRTIRFVYQRPFVSGLVPASTHGYEGLIVLGAGPYGVCSEHVLPGISAEIKLIQAFLEAGYPVVAIGTGAILLAMASGGAAERAPLRCRVGTATRVEDDALCGNLPQSFPYAMYLRDRPRLPVSAKILAVNEDDEPLLYQLGDRSFGFMAHPGMKTGMIEDLVMEFEDSPENVSDCVAALAAAQTRIADSLSAIMVGLVKATGWMS